MSTFFFSLHNRAPTCNNQPLSQSLSLNNFLDRFGPIVVLPLALAAAVVVAAAVGAPPAVLARGSLPVHLRGRGGRGRSVWGWN